MKAIEKRRQMAGQQGFTLIELLIVIAILGILAAVVVFAVGNVTDNATEKACDIEQRTIKTAAEAYKANAGTGLYPTAAQLSDGGDNAFLEDPIDTGKWTYALTGATPGEGYTLAGVGDCA
jgi:prepilin-type N-terminal cleavage/methylation domain-containing protein